MSAIRVKNTLDELPAVFEFVAAVLSPRGLAGGTLENNVCLCLDEIFANIVRYAYADDAVHEILISLDFSAKKRELLLCVEDDGAAFNPLSAAKPDIDSPLEERDIGGLGLFIVTQIAQSIAYERAGDKNRLYVAVGL